MSYGNRSIDPGATPTAPVAVVVIDGEEVQVVATAGATSWNTGRVTIADTATLIAAARSTRKILRIQNHSSVDVDLGPNGVVAGGGYRLFGSDGAEKELTHRAAVYGIVATGLTAVVSFEEEFD